MHAPLLYEDMAALRCAERQQQSLHNWYVIQALAEAPPARRARGLTAVLRHAALRAAWRLTRLAGADGGLYTVKGEATLIDTRGMTRTVCCPDETFVLLLPRTDRDAA